MVRRVEPLPPILVTMEAQLAGTGPQDPIHTPARDTHLLCPTCNVVPLAHEVLEEAVDALRAEVQEKAGALQAALKERDHLRLQTPLQTQMEADAATDLLASVVRDHEALHHRQDEIQAQLNAAEFQLAETKRQLAEAQKACDVAVVRLDAYRRYLPTPTTPK